MLMFFLDTKIPPRHLLLQSIDSSVNVILEFKKIICLNSFYVLSIQPSFLEILIIYGLNLYSLFILTFSLVFLTFCKFFYFAYFNLSSSCIFNKVFFYVLGNVDFISVFSFSHVTSKIFQRSVLPLSVTSLYLP